MACTIEETAAPEAPEASNEDDTTEETAEENAFKKAMATVSHTTSKNTSQADSDIKVFDKAVEEKFIFDVDLHLLRSIVSEHVHQVHVSLLRQYVVRLNTEVLRLIHLHVLVDRSRNLSS